jgi:hypothetical protein
LANAQTTTIDLYIYQNDTGILEIRIENTCPKSRKKANQGIGIGLKLVSDRLSLLSELHPDLFRTSFSSGVVEQNKYVVRIEIERFMTPAESFQIMNQLRNPNTKQKGVNQGGG